MKIAIKNEVAPKTLLEDLERQFPNYKVKHPILNKKIVNVNNGDIGLVIWPKKEGIKITSGLNLASWLGIVFVLLLVLTLIGAFIFYGIMWYVRKDKFKALEEEIGEFIQHKLNI